MSTFQVLLKGLRQAEQGLEKQLANVRNAISSLAGSTGKTGKRRGRPAGAKNKAQPKGIIIVGGKGRWKMSAKARRAISMAQKKRWAKKKAAK